MYDFNTARGIAEKTAEATQAAILEQLNDLVQKGLLKIELSRPQLTVNEDIKSTSVNVV